MLGVAPATQLAERGVVVTLVTDGPLAWGVRPLAVVAELLRIAEPPPTTGCA